MVRREAKPAPEAEGGIGIDWGVSTTATTTDQKYDLPYLGHRRRCAAELAKAQRKMTRRYRKGQKQTNGYQRARRQAARMHKKAARQTQHDSRVWARKITDNHDLIAVEDFKPTFLTRSTMARKAADAAIGAGRKVVLVTPASTTMTYHGASREPGNACCWMNASLSVLPADWSRTGTATQPG